jgi:hypothetical protein
LIQGLGEDLKQQLSENKAIEFTAMVLTFLFAKRVHKYYSQKKKKK